MRGDHEGLAVIQDRLVELVEAPLIQGLDGSLRPEPRRPSRDIELRTRSDQTSGKQSNVLAVCTYLECGQLARKSTMAE